MAAGIHVVSKRLASGTKTHYVYAWRGGPKIHQSEGERKPRLTVSIQDAAADARRSRPNVDSLKLRHLTEEWLTSGEYLRLSVPSQKTFQTWVPRIDAEFGDVPLDVFNNKKMRLDIVDWRDKWAAQPRTADHAVQSIRRILSYGVSRFKVDINCAMGIPLLYEVDRSLVTWTQDDVDAFSKLANFPMNDALILEQCTGFRRTDLARVTWAAVDDWSISWLTSKSRGKRMVVVPLLDEARMLLNNIKARHDREMADRPASKRVPLPATILSTAFWRPWSPDGLGSAFTRAMIAAGVEKHLHDMRGNFVTRLAKAKLPADQIADIVGWSLSDVQQMLRRYVNKKDLAGSQVRQIIESERL